MTGTEAACLPAKRDLANKPSPRVSHLVIAVAVVELTGDWHPPHQQSQLNLGGCKKWTRESESCPLKKSRLGEERGKGFVCVLSLSRGQLYPPPPTPPLQPSRSEVVSLVVRSAGLCWVD